MANYTQELHEMVEAFIPPETLFDFTYPLFDPLHKADLEAKIYNHYYFHEIGFETKDRFKHQLSARLNEIMPNYNKMYAQLVADVLVLSNSKTNAVGSVNSTNNTTNGGTSTSQNINLFSDTPQGATDFTTPSTYVTEVKKDNGTVTDASTGSATSTNANVIDFAGYAGITESELRKIYFDNLTDVDQLVIRDLADLFMQLY